MSLIGTTSISICGAVAVRFRPQAWSNILIEDSTSDYMNVLSMVFSMLGIMMRYKACSWIALLLSAVSFANTRIGDDIKQIMSTFMLSVSSVFMSYLANPLPISAAYFNTPEPSSRP
ncbi:hypothetical protein GZH46_00690 [Fragariocoptes setiger]|uniref:Protein Asterix n=1 Tax=Fragariocoptes setiger TaxID=1670756 RepID=A0ABQ7SBF3_9ACAR|nr:hypothetical protein GZH46_00690 [Fragariocoptes setiger]